MAPPPLRTHRALRFSTDICSTHFRGCAVQQLAVCKAVRALRRRLTVFRAGTRRSCITEYSHTDPNPSARMALFVVLHRFTTVYAPFLGFRMCRNCAEMLACG